MRGDSQLSLPMVVDEAPAREWTGNRRDCAEGPRPCHLVRCPMHLLLDVSAAGTMFSPGLPGLRVGASEEYAERWMEQLADRIAAAPYTCALDLAERGGMATEDIAAVMAVTKQRAHQIEVKAEKALEEKLSQIHSRKPIPDGHRVCRRCAHVFEAEGKTKYCSAECRHLGYAAAKRGKGPASRRLPSGRVVRVLAVTRTRQLNNPHPSE